MDAELFVKELVSRARAAQQEFEKCTQEQVDEACRAIAKAICDNAEPLARMAVDETRMGVYEDKVKKNQGKARVIWNDMKGGKSVGIIDREPEKGLVLVAKPMGVVGAVTPTTNPIVTPMCNAMFALKGRNAIVICPHPRSKNCSGEAVRLMKAALPEFVPQDIIQIIDEPTVELSGQVMKQCDVCISTGGMGMVRAAYASGKPAFGVGAGNVQCLIDEDADLETAIPMIIEGRRFDNGIICSGEQTAIMPKSIFAKAIEIFKKNGALYIDKPEDVQKLRETVFPGGVIDKNIVGQSAKVVAEKCGFAYGDDLKVILVKADAYGKSDLLSKEKMCPVIATYDSLADWDECHRRSEREPERRRQGPQRLHPFAQFRSYRSRGAGAAGIPLPGQSDLRNQQRRLVLQQPFRHHHARLRQLGQQFHFRKPLLAASVQRQPHRQRPSRRHDADRRGNLGVNFNETDGISGAAAV